MNNWVVTDIQEARWLANRLDLLAERNAADQRGDCAVAAWLADVYDLAAGRTSDDEGLPVPREILPAWGATTLLAAWRVGASERAVIKRIHTGRLRGYRREDGAWAIDELDVQDWAEKRRTTGQASRLHPDITFERWLKDRWEQLDARFRLARQLARDAPADLVAEYHRFLCEDLECYDDEVRWFQAVQEVEMERLEAELRLLRLELRLTEEWEAAGWPTCDGIGPGHEVVHLGRMSICVHGGPTST